MTTHNIWCLSPCFHGQGLQQYHIQHHTMFMQVVNGEFCDTGKRIKVKSQYLRRWKNEISSSLKYILQSLSGVISVYYVCINKGETFVPVAAFPLYQLHLQLTQHQSSPAWIVHKERKRNGAANPSNRGCIGAAPQKSSAPRREMLAFLANHTMLARCSL